MTVTTQVNVVTALGNGATPIFSYNFLIPVASDVSVIFTDALGNQTVLTPTQYTITGIGNAQGGTVTYPLAGPPIPSGTLLTIARILPLQQNTSISNQGSFSPTVIETALDYEMMALQQVSNQTGRALVAPIVDPTPPLPLPAASQRANQLLGFDGNGNPIAAQPSSAPVSTVMVPVVDAATLALARTALGLGAAAVENLGGSIIDDGNGNLTLGPNAIQPGNINAPFSNLNAGSVTDLGTIPSHNVNILGTASINSFGGSANVSAPIYNVEFAASCTLVYNATSMILPGAANITTQAGDTASLVYLGSSNWQVLGYARSGATKGTLVKVQVLSAASGTYVRTPGASTGTLYGCGAGGGGGGCAATGAGQASIGAGGGSGAEGWRFNYPLPATAPYVTGTPGSTGSGASGGAGGTTTFNTTDLICPGGLGGGAGAAVTFGTVINAQNPGAGGATGSGGNINYAGSTGGTGIITTSTVNGGIGGKATYGSAPGGANLGAVPAASGVGSGGGGAANGPSSAAQSGGTPVQGIIIIWEYA